MKFYFLATILLITVGLIENQAEVFHPSMLMAYHSCSRIRHINSKLFDGIIDADNFEVISIDCEMEELVRVEVKISAVSNIGSVTVYSGRCDSCDGLLDNFVVKLYSSLSYNNQDITKECGHYNGRFLEPGKPMRVNCEVQKNYDDEVVMVGIFPNEYQKFMSTNSSISEIIINLLGCLEYFSEHAFYGCYENFEGDVFYGHDSDSCKRNCASRSYRFMTLSYYGECKCGSKEPQTMVATETCARTCFESKIICYTKGSYAVYLARIPHIRSIGCFPVPTTGVRFSMNNMTSVSCIKECSIKGYVYSHTNTTECHCTNEELEDEQNPHQCNLDCPGDDSRCGGIEVVSVYSGCIEDPSESSCTILYKCVDKEFDQFGICLSHCEDGWLGPYCIIREIPSPLKFQRRPPLSFKPKYEQKDSKLPAQCRQAIQDLRSKMSPHPRVKKKCEQIVFGKRRSKSGLTTQSVLIIIFFVIVISSASGTAIGLYYERTYTVAQMKKMAAD